MLAAEFAAQVKGGLYNEIILCCHTSLSFEIQHNSYRLLLLWNFSAFTNYTL
jgi:hypothetical protein